MKIIEIIISILIMFLILYLCGMINSISLYFKDRKEITRESGEISRVNYTTDMEVRQEKNISFGRSIETVQTRHSQRHLRCFPAAHATNFAHNQALTS